MSADIQPRLNSLLRLQSGIHGCFMEQFVLKRERGAFENHVICNASVGVDGGKHTILLQINKSLR